MRGNEPEQNKHTTMTTAAAISIVNNPILEKYSHAAPIASAEKLAARIEKLESAGFTVLGATGFRRSVPNCYRGAWKIRAPYNVFRAETRTIEMVDAQLETRSNGKLIPSRYEIAGQTVPSGYRCILRKENSIEICPI